MNKLLTIKPWIIFLSIIGFLIMGVFILLKQSNDFLMLWNSNKVHVETENSLTKEKVKIEFGISVNTINRENDLELFFDRGKYIIIYNSGRNLNTIINEYGENDFLITYNNEFYYSFRHFKSNRRHQHLYNFKFSKQANDIILNVEIVGTNEMAFERKMLKIKEADMHICSTPIDSAGTVYNMIELNKE
ncbi:MULTISPECIES: hypothetical protein [unclassified Tenacibaculum]|uniref:hypothetical protein n=1 Tax=unclassified Tenacibaculum TaxID=2635139 RepID=UPI001F27D0E7|nr:MULTISPECIES: hypothetical protein [unclassified Tenacibaculum]MCF2875928.1 hypothetical protein [Tenacibaculum sp. Cn5-1]MCF2936003.1 hypothetical protein [Tenacibaculum sp. Cn5-34]MCG7512564.1 hypothetical protein [Tenacibaculum sp. Cn5-46]